MKTKEKIKLEKHWEEHDVSPVVMGQTPKQKQLEDLKEKIIEESQQCCETIYDRDTWTDHQCTRKAIVKRNGKFYCRIHDPEYIKAKEKQQEQQYENESCKKCQYHFDYKWYCYCPICGTKKTQPNSN